MAGIFFVIAILPLFCRPVEAHVVLGRRVGDEQDAAWGVIPYVDDPDAEHRCLTCYRNEKDETVVLGCSPSDAELTAGLTATPPRPKGTT